MRVVYVALHATRGVAERVTMDLIAMHAPRSEVEPVVLFLHGGPLVEEARRLGVQAQVFPVPRMRNVLAAERAKRALAQRLVSLKAELVHSVMARGHVYAGAAASIARVPAVWSQHEVPDWHRVDNLLAALIPARRILANSALTASAQRRFNPRRIKIEVVHPGTRIPTETRDARRTRARAALGLGAAEYVVGMVAPVARGQGHPTLLRAAQHLCAARSDARVVLAGSPIGRDPDYAAELARLAASLRIADRVRFTGDAEGMGTVLSALDVTVHLPDTPESFEFAVVEGMAAGSAIVAADSGPVREIVEPGVTALLVPNGEHEVLATTLLALHDDPGLREQLATAGAEAARTRFDSHQMARRVEAIYGDAVA